MRKILTIFGLLLMLASCSSTKDIAYFQDVEHGATINVAHKQLTLLPEDKISILVNTRNQELTNSLNLPYVTRQLGTSTNASTSQGVAGYTIDKDGFINFPQLGKLHIAGMTRSEVAEHIKNQLNEKGIAKDAIVTVEYSNLRYSVLGEVKSPNTYAIDRDAITILDAISKAGDLTIQGERTNVQVIRRENNNEEKVYTLNLCSLQDVQQSPAYYIQQNDVIYVKPNKMRERQSTVNGNNIRSSAFWISIASLLTSVINLLTR